MTHPITRCPITKGWNRFFFTSDKPYGLACIRLLLPVLLAVTAMRRWPFARELYSTDGATTPLWDGYRHFEMLPTPSGTVAVVLFTLLIFCLWSAAVGWQTRVSLWTATLLYPYFGMLDSTGTLTKYTVVASHALLLMAMSDCGRLWSVDAWLQRRSSTGIDDAATRSPAWPLRLLQLFLCALYLGSGLTKLRSMGFMQGDHVLFAMLGDLNFAHPLGHQLALHPIVVTLMSYVTLLWELLFAFVIWNRSARPVVLLMGLLFHVSALLTIGLIVFPLLDIILLMAFIEPRHWERLLITIRRFTRRWSIGIARPVSVRPWASSVGFIIILGATAMAAVPVEHWLDPFDERRAEGPHVLEPLDHARAMTMLSGARALRPEDRLFRFHIGTRLIAGHLADEREQFAVGETMLVETMLIPPHPDMWLMVSLQSATGRTVERWPSLISREMLRHYTEVPLPDHLPAGAYDVVLRYEQTEVARRTVQVTAAASAMVAGRVGR